MNDMALYPYMVNLGMPENLTATEQGRWLWEREKKHRKEVDRLRDTLRAWQKNAAKHWRVSDE